jgi:segregation and condensation protein B
VQSEDLSRVVEALLLSADTPVTLDRLAEVVPEADRAQIREAVAGLRDHYDREGHAFTVAEVAGGWQLYCRPDYAKWVRELQKGRIPAKLSQAALETLAIVAYRQPMVRTEIESVRGVDSSGVLATLLRRNLVAIAGRAPGMGRALMYRTTKEFLRYFGLNTLTDLPRLQEFAEVLGLKPEELESTLAASESLAAFAGEESGGETPAAPDDAGDDAELAPAPDDEFEDAVELPEEPQHAVGDLAIIRSSDEA